MTAREAILGRIREANAGRRASGSSGEIVRGYRQAWDPAAGSRIERLVERLQAYGVAVLRARSDEEIAGLAERCFTEHKVASLLVPPDLPASWRPRTPEAIEDSGQGPHELDRIKGVMTGCAVAIAETGTIVLDAGAFQGRRAVTLVPDVYVCVVFASQVVGIVPEAVALLHEAARDGRPITFISGPSATADIELDRVVGVHGPRTLDVILVEGGPAGH